MALFSSFLLVTYMHGIHEVCTSINLHCACGLTSVEWYVMLGKTKQNEQTINDEIKSWGDEICECVLSSCCQKDQVLLRRRNISDLWERTSWRAEYEEK